MGWVVQINPTSPVHSIRGDLVNALESHLEDFELRYCSLEPSARALRALRAYEPAWDEERVAVAEIISLLERGETVELLLGY